MLQRIQSSALQISRRTKTRVADYPAPGEIATVGL
jgi:hypothetical protein